MPCTLQPKVPCTLLACRAPFCQVAASLPPRWEYLAVQKALFFHFDPVEDDPAAAAAAAEAAAAAAREREEGRGYIGVEEEPEMVSASSALPLESFFQSVFLSEADGAWYLRLKHEDRQGRPHTFSEALGSFEAFLRQQVRRLPLCAEVACMHIACAPIACACASHVRVHGLCVSAVSRGR